MVMVVIGHLLPWTFGVNNSIILTLFATIELPIFFYIAGFFSSNKKSECSLSTGFKVILKSFVRYIIPMLTVGFLAQLMTDYPFMDSLLYRGGGRYWFLYTLFLIVVIGTICNLVIRFINSANKFLICIVYGLPYLVLLVIKYIGVNIPSLFPLSSILVYYPFYILGVLAVRIEAIHTILLESKLVLSMSMIGVMFGTWWLSSSSNLLISQFVALCAIVLFLQIFANLCKSFLDNKVLSLLTRIGKSTLSIYLLHYFFIFDMKWMEPYLTTSNPVALQLCVSMVAALVIISICMALEWILNRTQITSFLFLGKLLRNNNNI